MLTPSAERAIPVLVLSAVIMVAVWLVRWVWGA